MKCPKCRTETLRSITVDEVEVDRCSTCDGIWFDRGELGGLLDSKEEMGLQPLMDGQDQVGLDMRGGVCPRHNNAMIRVKSLRNREVSVETCPVCQGIWLDGGEFRTIREKMPNFRFGDLV